MWYCMASCYKSFIPRFSELNGYEAWDLFNRLTRKTKVWILLIQIKLQMYLLIIPPPFSISFEYEEINQYSGEPLVAFYKETNYKLWYFYMLYTC
jgi:hypothetical protein